jgi:hypothetical protein
MFIIRFLLLLFLILLVRRVYLAYKSSGTRKQFRSTKGPAPKRAPGAKRKNQGMEDLTEQDISDADFEEIP